jgi:hypothetical protein
MHVWLRALRRIVSTVPCMPWRVIFPSSSSACKAFKSCSSCVECTQLGMTCGPYVCPGDKALPSAMYLHFSLSKVPKVSSTVRCCGILTYLPKPASCRLALTLPLRTYLTSSMTDPRSQILYLLSQALCHPLPRLPLC